MEEGGGAIFTPRDVNPSFQHILDFYTNNVAGDSVKGIFLSLASHIKTIIDAVSSANPV